MSGTTQQCKVEISMIRLASHSLQARAQRFAPRAQHALSTWKIRIKQVREPELARDWANWGPKQEVIREPVRVTQHLVKSHFARYETGLASRSVIPSH